MEEKNRDNESLSDRQRIFRLESQMVEVKSELAAVTDMSKNAHHRISETQADFQAFRAEVNRKLDNLGANLAKKEISDRKWHKALIVVAVFAVVALLCVFIQDSGIRRSVAELALSFGAKAAAGL